MPAQTDPGYFFMPNHIILIGASEQPYSLGKRVLSNLLSTPFQGKITPVNPRHHTIAGLPAYTSLNKIPGSADLIIAVTPPDSYDTLLKTCRKKQLRHIILIQDWDSLSAAELHTPPKLPSANTTATDSTSPPAPPQASNCPHSDSTSVPKTDMPQAIPPY